MLVLVWEACTLNTCLAAGNTAAFLFVVALVFCLWRDGCVPMGRQKYKARCPAATTSLGGSETGGPASKSYSIASTWDQMAPADSGPAGRHRLGGGSLRQAPHSCTCTRRSTSHNERKDQSHSGGEQTSVMEAPSDGVVLHTSQKFYEWHAKLEAARAAAAEHKYRQYSERLADQLMPAARLAPLLTILWRGSTPCCPATARRSAAHAPSATPASGSWTNGSSSSSTRRRSALGSRSSKSWNGVASEFHSIAGSGSDRPAGSLDSARLPVAPAADGRLHRVRGVQPALCGVVRVCKPVQGVAVEGAWRIAAPGQPGVEGGQQSGKQRSEGRGERCKRLPTRAPRRLLPLAKVLRPLCCT